MDTKTINSYLTEAGDGIIITCLLLSGIFLLFICHYVQIGAPSAFKSTILLIMIFTLLVLLSHPMKSVYDRGDPWDPSWIGDYLSFYGKLGLSLSIGVLLLLIALNGIEMILILDGEPFSFKILPFSDRLT